MAMRAARCRGSLACLALLVSAGLLASCGKSKTDAEYIHDAQAHRASGDLPTAVIDLENALQQNGQNTEARVLLAECLIDMGDGSGADAELVQAKHDGADPALLSKDFGNAWLIEGKLSRVIAAPALPASDPADLQADVLSVRARAYIALGQMADAHRAIEFGLEKDARSLPILRASVEYALANGDQNDAQARLVEAQAVAPNDRRVIELQGEVAMAAKDFHDADQIFRHVLATESWNMRVHMRLAQVQIAQGEYSDADSNLAILLEAAPKNPNVNFLAGLSKFRAKDFADALRYGQAALGST